MDILTHTFSGLAAGIVITGFSKKGQLHKTGIAVFSAFGASLPDIDTMSLWPGFDRIIGKLFGLALNGKEIYFGKLWYSHHGFIHSIVGALLMTLILSLFFFVFYKLRRKISPNKWLDVIKNTKLILFGFFIGYTIHLFEDMVTPACTWGGVRFLWPLKTYVGGSGDIWWYNNYDLFLIVCMVIILNLIVIGVNKKLRKNIKYIVSAIFAIGTSLMIIQIKTRSFDFEYTGHKANFYEYDKKAKEIQKEILSPKVYKMMNDFDNHTKIHF